MGHTSEEGFDGSRPNIPEKTSRQDQPLCGIFPTFLAGIKRICMAVIALQYHSIFMVYCF
jgi:hypothetical protein